MDISKGKFLISLLIIFSIFSFIVIGSENSNIPDKATEDAIWEEIKNEDPAFTNIVTTIYHTANFEDYDSWYEGADNNYDVDTPLGYCVIPEHRRGFYEDVKCLGSGIEGSDFYYHESIKKQKDNSVIEGTNTRGKTAQGNEPVSKWTVAVNPIKGTDCHIPYGTKMYIRFGPNNPWNGVYLADDTGSAFKGECKMDIYSGVGKQSADEAYSDGVDGQRPKIYLLNDQYEYIPPRELEIMGSHGSMGANYRYSSKNNNLGDLINYAKEFSRGVSSNNNNDNNLKNSIERASDNGYKISDVCPMTGISYVNATSEVIIEDNYKGSAFYFVGVVQEKFNSGGINYSLAVDPKGNEFLLKNMSDISLGTSFEIGMFVSDEDTNLAKFDKTDKTISKVSRDEDLTNIVTRPSEILIPIFDNEYNNIRVEENEVAAKTILGDLASQFASCASSLSNNICDCNITKESPWDNIAVNDGTIAVPDLGYSALANLSIVNQTNHTAFTLSKNDLINVSFDGISLKVGNEESKGSTCEPEYDYSLFCISRNFDIRSANSNSLISYFNSNSRPLTFNFAVASKR